MSFGIKDLAVFKGGCRVLWGGAGCCGSMNRKEWSAEDQKSSENTVILFGRVTPMELGHGAQSGGGFHKGSGRCVRWLTVLSSN